MDDHAQRSRLDTIEQEISALRFRYLRAEWACHTGEAEMIEAEIDAKLDEWDAISHGKKAARG